MPEKQRMPWFKWWADRIEIELSQFNSDLEAIGILVRILNKMWLGPSRGFLCYNSGAFVKRKDVGKFLNLDQNRVEKILERILPISGLISEDGKSLKSDYLIEMADSWQKHKRGDR